MASSTGLLAGRRAALPGASTSYIASGRLHHAHVPLLRRLGGRQGRPSLPLGVAQPQHETADGESSQKRLLTSQIYIMGLESKQSPLRKAKLQALEQLVQQEVTDQPSTAFPPSAELSSLGLAPSPTAGDDALVARASSHQGASTSGSVASDALAPVSGDHVRLASHSSEHAATSTPSQLHHEAINTAMPASHHLAAASGTQTPGGNSNGVEQQPQGEPSATAAESKDVPRPIWILCCISAALTCASCVFNTALPIYMVSELKMSMKSMGMFEGLLEAFSYVVRMCSGIISDRMTSRKAAITLGFAMGAAAKFGMASAGSVTQLFAGKAMDRLANGIQAAPRDALIGDLSPAHVRSSSFGLAQSLRKWGSACGALITFFLMKASNNNYQMIFGAAASVSLLACLAFVVFVPAHARQDAASASATPVAASTSASTAGAVTAAPAASQPKASSSGLVELWQNVRGMGSDFYRMLGVICCYAMGHINESLLEARAIECGFGKAEATLVVAALCVFTFLTAYPLGRLDDKYGPRVTFAVGISALIAGNLVLLFSGAHPAAVFIACGFLGVHWAVIQGSLLSVMANLAPAHLRGTAFGIFYTAMALTAVAANTMYGTIWHTFGATAAFATSAGLMVAVLTALPTMLPAAASPGGARAAAKPAPLPSGVGLVPGVSPPMPAAA